MFWSILQRKDDRRSQISRRLCGPWKISLDNSPTRLTWLPFRKVSSGSKLESAQNQNEGFITLFHLSSHNCVKVLLRQIYMNGVYCGPIQYERTYNGCQSSTLWQNNVSMILVRSITSSISSKVRSNTRSSETHLPIHGIYMMNQLAQPRAFRQ